MERKKSRERDLTFDLLSLHVFQPSINTHQLGHQVALFYINILQSSILICANNTTHIFKVNHIDTSTVGN